MKTQINPSDGTGPKVYSSPAKTKQAEHMLKVIQAFLDGKEIVSRSRMGDRWKVCRHPAWNFNAVYYEISANVNC